LDDAISEQIKQLALDPEYFQSLKQSDDAPQIKAIKQQLKTINAQLSRFLDLYGTGRFSIEDLDAKTQPLTEQREQLQKELDRLQASRRHITSDQAIQLAEAFDAATLEEKQIIIKQLIDKIIINDDDINIYWNI
jgi:chromosome segregation ATPase